ncbi:MAG: tRNA (5-methylaminomethyl-2-thiouridine)(34)-methyltransferase MnmD, partial [Planktomarina sp.]
MSDHQSPHLEWRDGTPIATRFDDPYFSLDNGVAETAHVFLAGNDLPARFVDGFHVCELGFGTGLNLLVTLHAWRQAKCIGRLHFTTFEAFPMTPADMRQAQAAFPELQDVASELSDHWGKQQFDTHDLAFRMIPGDARDTLPHWTGLADAWYLDGFSPTKNPELWGDALLTQVGAHTRLGGTFATYTAAGSVRRGLENAGFSVTRTTGFGRKRHM